MKNYNLLQRLSLLGCLLGFAAIAATARPAWRKPAEVKQPDGTVLTLQLHGDEYHSFSTTTDGYTVVKDSRGYYCYADVADGMLRPTNIVASDPGARNASQKAFLSQRAKMMRPEMTPHAKAMKETTAQMFGNNLCTSTLPSGIDSGKQHHSQSPRKAGYNRINYSDFKGLVILVEYNNRKFLRDDALNFYQDLTSKKDHRGYYDASGEKYTEIDGSVRDYFFQNSMGIFDPTFDVVGPVEIPYPDTYVGKDNKNIYPVLKSALEKANEKVDFTQYDLDENGYVDMVYFIFAGYGSYMPGNNENYVWPHASNLAYYSRFMGLRYDGMMFSRYACSVEIQDLEELADKQQTLDGIGTMCHEFSHVLGLADHYDTDYEENGETEHPGEWDVMASGADYNNGLTPAGYSAYERYSLGFAPLRTLEVAGSYELKPFNEANEFYRIPTETRNEFFFIENRQKMGWDRFIPGHGLLVWRVDSTNKKVWDDNTVNCNPSHMYIEVLRARPDKGINTAWTPFPGTSNITDLTANGYPQLKTWAGTDALMDLYDITETPDGIIAFNAGKNLYESVVEDFEDMALTTSDAADIPGKLSNWTLTNAIIASATAEGTGNGNQVAKLKRSGTISTTTLSNAVRNVCFHVWTTSQQVRISLLENSSGKWKELPNTDGDTQTTLKKNSNMTMSFITDLPAGTQLQLKMLATSGQAVAYIDDITVSLGNATSGICDAISERATTTDAYNLSGQRVANGYRGIVVRDGKKLVQRR